jgi:hypothetical protein
MFPHNLVLSFLSGSNVSITSLKWNLLVPRSTPSGHSTSLPWTRIGGYVHKILGLMAQFALVLPSLCPQRTPPTQQLAASACTLLNPETLNCNNVSLPIFTRPFVPASVASPETKLIQSTNSAPGLSVRWIWSTSSKQEIEAIISAPLNHFLDFRDFCSNVHLNYEFLTSAGHAIPELTRIDSFMRSIEPFTQFDSYVTTWTTANALGTRTLASLTKFLLDQYGDMPTASTPRGGNAFYVGKYKGKKGKGKGKDQDKGKGRGSKRTRDTDNNGTSLSSFSSSSFEPPNKQARLTSNTCPTLTAEHNPAKPYCYCWFHGWNFSHHGKNCKRILKSNDNARINATSSTSTNPPGNAYVEPAYKLWWI